MLRDVMLSVIMRGVANKSFIMVSIIVMCVV